MNIYPFNPILIHTNKDIIPHRNYCREEGNDNVKSFKFKTPVHFMPSTYAILIKILSEGIMVKKIALDIETIFEDILGLVHDLESNLSTHDVKGK